MRDRKVYYKEWYTKNRNRQLEKMKTWSRENPDSNKVSDRKYREQYPERRALSNIFQRCNNPLNHAFKYYGGRGIKCFYTSANEIIAEIGKRPGSMYSIDRINNEGNYEPGNIRWATSTQRALNRRTSR